ncbi:MAG: hypothetical protein C0483_23185 [Pirellula sp.]|nr:hypothetical protein [Pirellula sp.]
MFALAVDRPRGCCAAVRFTPSPDLRRHRPRSVVGKLLEIVTAVLELPGWNGIVCAMADSSNASGRDADGDLAKIAAALRGDEHAYSELVARHQATIVAQMWRFGRDRVMTEELTHEVFVEAWLSLSKYRAQAPFEHWLRRIALRVGYRFWKRQARERHRGVQSLQDSDYAGSAETSDAQEAGEQVQRLLAQLPPRDRLVLMLLYLDQCSVEEAADRIGWTRTMVRVQAHRARKKLKTLLDAEGSGAQDSSDGGTA